MLESVFFHDVSARSPPGGGDAARDPAQLWAEVQAANGTGFNSSK